MTQSAIPSSEITFFTRLYSPRPLLIQKLKTLLEKLDLATLTEQQIFCLQLITQDYEQGLLGTSILATDILVKKLLTSVTLGNLRPKVEITTGLDIRVETFLDYFCTFSTRVASLPLNEEVTKTMREVMLPGIEAIIRDEDTIVNHVTMHFGQLYYLNEKLPLHTDHIPTTDADADADADAYRHTLRRLLTNLFGAIEIAHSSGRLSEFCEKLSSGYCFEGRVRDAFTWVASLTEIVSFDDLMNRYIHQEYLPYTAVMSGTTDESAMFVSTACDFIMARHKGMPCLINSTYAPAGDVTQSGVRKYLIDVLDFSLTAGLSCVLMACFKK